MKTLLLLVAAILLTGAASSYEPVPYPEGWQSWRHVKSMVIQQGHPLFGAFGGIHHLYANDKAVQGYTSGEWPDGAIIVFDLHQAVSANNTITAGDRKVLGVMLKDRQAYPDTGGWGFEGFKGTSTTERAVGNNAATACFACHQAKAGADFVFSDLQKAARSE